MNILINSTKSFLRSWLIPPKPYQLGSNVLNRFSSSSQLDLSILDKNKNLTGIGQGKRCFIIGTGPSLKYLDLSILADEYCLGLNGWYLHPQYSILRKKYNVISGFSCHSDFFNNSDANNYWFREIECNIDDSPMLLNIPDFKIFESSEKLRSNPKYYFHFPKNWEDLMLDSIDLTKSMHTFQNVAIMAIQVALGMGFSEIVLLGMDHTMILLMVDKTHPHFYEHSAEDEIPQEYLTDIQNVENILDGNLKIWRQHKHLKEYATKKNVKILNATVGSLLDVYPRIDFSSLLA